MHRCFWVVKMVIVRRIFQEITRTRVPKLMATKLLAFAGASDVTERLVTEEARALDV